LLLHEFATNAAKHGAISVSTGTIDIECTENGNETILVWRERGVANASTGDLEAGFGSVLIRTTVEHSLQGTFSQNLSGDGLKLKIRFPAHGKSFRGLLRGVPM